jgi:hypothetical protein
MRLIRPILSRFGAGGDSDRDGWSHTVSGVSQHSPSIPGTHPSTLDDRTRLRRVLDALYRLDDLVLGASRLRPIVRAVVIAWPYTLLYALGAVIVLFVPGK